MIKVLSIKDDVKDKDYCIVEIIKGNKTLFRKRRKYKTKTKNKYLMVIENDVYSFVLNNNIGENIKYVRKNKKHNSEEQENDKEEDWTETELEKIKTFKSNKEVKHSKYNQIKSCVDLKIPVYLVGPAGSGKNFTLEQIAKESGMNFYFSNSIQQEYKLTGFIDAGGKYHETEFYKACTDEKECIFFLDEMDASIPEVLVLLNAAIANGYFEFPTGKVNLENVHFVAAGNTVGNGADEQYTGRLTLDQATLDRFAIIEFGYDLNIEMSLSKGNSELVSFIRQLREEAERKGIRATFSYRCITMVTKLESVMKLNEILQISVMKGFDKDTIRTLNPIGDTKYHKALKELQRVA